MESVVDSLPAGPSADGEDAPFWEALQDDRLVLPRCAACRTWRPIGLLTCASCWSLDTTWDEVAATGTVYTWVRTHRDFMSELDVPAPYVTVLVEIDDVGIRLLGLLRGADEVAIGDRVTGLFERPENSDWTVLRWEAAA